MSNPTGPIKTSEPYLFVAPGQRGVSLLTSPSGESVVLVCSKKDGMAHIMIATPDGRRIEADGWKLTEVRSSAEVNR